jgi:coproporphyrinogen III oxidase
MEVELMQTLAIDKKQEIVAYLKDLRDSIIASFERLEGGQSFERECWDYSNGKGGGEMSVLRGKVFEKAAVNWSGISGGNFPMGDGQGPFFATGVSLITHMSNPHVPTVHMNLRYISTEKSSWFGGGYDLTPMDFPYTEDTEHFHNVAKETLGLKLYEKFSKQAKEYFYIPHWKRERGVGGIFFDHHNTGNEEDDMKMWKSVGDTFLDAIIPIYEKRISHAYTAEDKEQQLLARGRYAEFNLAYDRGTRFGFQSGGNPKAILCSMPPVAHW